jgi:hypothetical protein
MRVPWSVVRYTDSLNGPNLVQHVTLLYTLRKELEQPLSSKGCDQNA